MSTCMDKFSLCGKVIIITGAAGFLGIMHTKAVLDAGGIPVMLDLSEQRLAESKEQLEKEYPGKSIEIFATSITEKAGLEHIRDALVEKYGKIDGLINNACNNPTMKDSDEGSGRFESFSYEEFLADTNVGLYGALLCSQIFGTYMAQNGGGSIVNISSDLGVIAPNQNLYTVEGKEEYQQPKKPVTYSTVKWGLIGLTKYLSTYWAEKNVRANAMAFGGVFNNQSETFLKRVEELIPMRRMANRDEYMGSIVYMLSDASSYMTGSVVSIDGGRTAW